MLYHDNRLSQVIREGLAYCACWRIGKPAGRICNHQLYRPLGPIGADRTRQQHHRGEAATGSYAFAHLSRHWYSQHGMGINGEWQSLKPYGFRLPMADSLHHGTGKRMADAGDCPSKMGTDVQLADAECATKKEGPL